MSGAREYGLALAIAMTLLAAWEIAARNGRVDVLVFPAPTAIVMSFGAIWREGMAHNVAVTLTRFVSGLALGSIPGLALGLAMGRSPQLRRIVDPFIAAIHPLPKIVLFPVLILLFGVSEWSRIASIALTAFFPAVINAAAGARQIPPLYLEVIRNYGGSRFDAFRHVVLPGSLPMVLNGLRIAANLSLLVTIAIEFTVMTAGVGSIIWIALQTMRIEQLYAGIVVISLIGISINIPLQLLLRRMANWM
jgi:ABC-type nitrate/sulfonate/bicarbonate transport system permease component